ncbi:putative mitochondrial protein [Cucumis melo var. makuwa]|uniref:Mitochondrial protein n=1 Tax=Cucumis melo var. makuwa TaxID=1194695 RepID=A0A5A7SW14_CUCMM|nr:putative mitochondrial protein [Cucumis melo var. makuwa]TYK31041.1 putative mitochondrial protein [Cucumis melo var. makuwa]
MNHNEDRRHTVTVSDNTDHLNLTIVYLLEIGTQESFMGDGNSGCITQSPSPMEPQHQTDSGMNTQLQSTSIHPMITRSKHGIFKPKAFLIDYTQTEPYNVKEAFNHPHWKKAMEEEFEALQKNDTWSLTSQNPNQKIVGCKWVFKIKRNSYRSIARYKVRLVAKEFHQTPNIDYHETFSPVVKPVTIRMLLTIAIMKGWSILKSSYPMVCHLKEALYGLKQAPQACFEKDVNSLVHSLNSQFALKDLGKLSYFLGVEVSYPTNGGRPFHDVHLYRSVAGALQYATLTHPEISYSVNKACQFMHTPKHTHWQLMKRILRYLKGVLYHGLWFRKSDNMSLVGFAYADWASGPDDKKSTSGFCVYFGNNLVS